MSTTFNDLPPELLVPILSPLPESSIVRCARVSREWNAFATPVLYRRVAVYSWNKNAKTRAAALMRTLAQRPDIARWVKHIDVRDFYRDFEFLTGQEEEREEVYEHCDRGLANCLNLESCVWPRHGTLTTSMILALSRLPRLERLELNAKSGTYEPADLVRIRQIRALGLTMPDKPAVDVLQRWFQAISDAGREDGEEGGLRDLRVICQSTNYIGDSMLARLAPYLTRLETFHLLGCPKADHVGVAAVLKVCSSTIRHLSLENVSLNFDLAELAMGIELPRLESLTLTLPTPPTPHEPFLKGLLQLTAASPLAALTLSLPATVAPPSTSLVLYNPSVAQQNTAPQPREYPHFTTEFARKLAQQHASTFRKLAITRLPTPLEAVETICAYCRKIETLIIPVHQFDWPRLAAAISASSLPYLRTLHMSYPTSPRIRPFIRHELVAVTVLTELAASCSLTLEQIGQINKVYEVVRKWDKGTDTTSVVLDRWLGPQFPEAFQVVRA
ncbi:hypothetical protein CALVIDRAFT_538738 [Calocera viscosa TUFC12733]|uniref:F-box domain-containing protein n=1 Tax=Calocera viscosa (strain TUFC12733) TaxID=1330018 RepID=A0A167KG55_CALVF|nr:hypothetical protein CALVIDRAFT_538738 [Calocera viscosa TUFC12733]